jgi:hypothetical protein
MKLLKYSMSLEGAGDGACTDEADVGVGGSRYVAAGEGRYDDMKL